MKIVMVVMMLRMLLLMMMMMMMMKMTLTIERRMTVTKTQAAHSTEGRQSFSLLPPKLSHVNLLLRLLLSLFLHVVRPGLGLKKTGPGGEVEETDRRLPRRRIVVRVVLPGRWRRIVVGVVLPGCWRRLSEKSQARNQLVQAAVHGWR